MQEILSLSSNDLNKMIIHDNESFKVSSLAENDYQTILRFNKDLMSADKQEDLLKELETLRKKYED